MRSRNRILSGILSCLTCLGSVGSASKGKPAAPPAGEARRKNGNGGNKKGDRNAKGKAGISPGIDVGKARNKGIVPGASTTTPRSGLSGRDIGFLAGGAIGGGTLLGVAGYCFGVQKNLKIKNLKIKNLKIKNLKIMRDIEGFIGEFVKIFREEDRGKILYFLNLIFHASTVMNIVPVDGGMMVSTSVKFDRDIDRGVRSIPFNFFFEYVCSSDEPSLRKSHVYRLYLLASEAKYYIMDCSFREFKGFRAMVVPCTLSSLAGILADYFFPGFDFSKVVKGEDMSGALSTLCWFGGCLQANCSVNISSGFVGQ